LLKSSKTTFPQSSCIKISDTKIYPHCTAPTLIKNGFTPNRKQQFYCKTCTKRCIDFYTSKGWHKEINANIIMLIKEGMGIRSIARFLSISTTTLLKRILLIANGVQTPPISSGQIYEVDEMRNFLRHKGKVIWIVYALDQINKNVISSAVGSRTKKTLYQVIQTTLLSNPKRIYTDWLILYKFLIHKTIHRVTRFGTNRIERKNLSLRTHLKRLNRRSICFSKSLLVLNAVLRIYFWL
jgi:insertion element IS1 protein InsB